VTALLSDLTIVFGLAVLSAVVCHRLRVPVSIGLLLVGVLAGPDALKLVRNAHDIELLSEIGVVALLFVVGLEFSAADLSRLKRQFFAGGSTQLLGTALVIGLASWTMGSAPRQDIYMGLVVALSSTAIVLRSLEQRAEMGTPHGRAVLAILVFQDIAVIPVMMLAPILAGSAGALGTSGLLESGLRLGALAVFAVAAYLWGIPWLFGRVAATRSSETFLLGVLSVCLGIAMLAQWAGLSLALGAFLAGFLISESEYSHQTVAAVLPFRDVFLSLFFISLGMLLDLSFVAENPVRIALLTLGVLAIKPLVAGVAALAAGLPLRNAVLAGMALGQVGEFSLVAAQAGVAAGVLGGEFFQTVLAVSMLSILATPTFIAVAPRLADLVCGTPLGSWGRKPVEPMPEDLSADKSGHIVVVGFGVTGRNLARTARIADVPYAIVELNAATVRRERAAGEPIWFGDATQETILRHVNVGEARAVAVVIDDPAGTRRIVELARRLAPDAFILVRSRYLHEVEPLIRLGADEVIADELEVSVEVFSRILARMLVPREDIKRLIGEVRGEWRRMARGLAKEATSVSDLRLGVPELTTHTVRLTPYSPLIDRSIAESGLRQQAGVTVLAVMRGEETIGNPVGSTIFVADDVLLLVGPADWDPSSVA
jgi:CPA2 family monovalent cation:H+ antiporter-2